MPDTNFSFEDLLNKLQGYVPSAQPTPENRDQASVSPNAIPVPTDVGQSNNVPPQQALNVPWLPGYRAPSVPRPSLTTPTGQIAPGTNKAQKLEVLIRSGLQGAMAGRAASEQAVVQSGGHRSGGFGTGFEAAQQVPIQRAMQEEDVHRAQMQNQQLQQQVQNAPQMQALGMRKTVAGIAKDEAEAEKATAETGAIPTKQALEQAQALAARFKEDSGSGTLIDLQTGQPVNAAGFVPLSAEEAGILGKQPGERVPLKLKNTANEMVNRGIRSVSADGRSLLVDSRGNTIKDMGVSPAQTTINNQLGGGEGTLTPDMQKSVDMVGHNQVDLPTALSGFRRFPGKQQAFLAALHDQYPDYFQGNFGSAKKVLEYFTSGEGGKNINAFNTATEHLGQLQQLATALQNKDNQTYNRVGNAIQAWLGKPAPSNFNLVKSAVAGEISKTFKGAVTDEEIKSITENVNTSMSPGQLSGVIGDALALMRSKMEANVQQYQQGRQGQPAFPGDGATPQSRTPVYRNGKIIGYTTDGKNMTPAGSQ